MIKKILLLIIRASYCSSITDKMRMLTKAEEMTKKLPVENKELAEIEEAFRRVGNRYKKIIAEKNQIIKQLEKKNI